MQPLAKLIWMDGRLRPWDDARVHVMAHSLHYGIGVFEGIRCYAQAHGPPAVFRLRDHVERLFDSARVCSMELPQSRAEVYDACRETVRVNGLDDCYVRPIACYVEGQPGLGAINPVQIAIAAFKWGAY